MNCVSSSLSHILHNLISLKLEKTLKALQSLRHLRSHRDDACSQPWAPNVGHCRSQCSVNHQTLLADVCWGIRPLVVILRDVPSSRVSIACTQGRKRSEVRQLQPPRQG